MANREKQSRNWLIVVGSVFVLAVCNENIASWLEQYGLNRLWAHTGAIGAGLLWMWGVLSSPIATHLYVFWAGLLIASIFHNRVKLSATSRTQIGMAKPDMTLPDLVDYLTTETAWAKSQRAISDLMVEHELLDAISTGRLILLARRTDAYGSTSQLFRIDPDYFEAHRLDLAAIRSGRGDAVVIKPGHFTGAPSFHDWRLYKSQAEQVWPAWVEPKPVVRRGFFGRGSKM